MNTLTQLTAPERKLYWLALIPFFALILLNYAWTLWWLPDYRQASLVVTSIFLAPLLILTPWLIRARPKAYALASMLALFYFTHACVELYSSPEERYPALAELVFSTWFYVGAVLFAKMRGKMLRIQSSVD